MHRECVAHQRRCYQSLPQPGWQVVEHVNRLFAPPELEELVQNSPLCRAMHRWSRLWHRERPTGLRHGQRKLHHPVPSPVSVRDTAQRFGASAGHFHTLRRARVITKTDAKIRASRTWTRAVAFLLPLLACHASSSARNLLTPCFQPLVHFVHAARLMHIKPFRHYLPLPSNCWLSRMSIR